MFRVLRVVFTAIVLFAIPFSKASGQSVHVIEDSIKFYLDKMQDYGNYSGKHVDGQEDSLSHYDKALKLYMKEMLVKQPLTLEYNFNKINKLMTIASSKDRKFRIYPWDSQDGGTMHGYNSVLQFKAGKEVCSVIYYIDTFINGEWNGSGYYYPKIYQLVLKNGKTYYLAERRGTYSSAVHSVGVECLTIEKGAINDSVKLFKTKSELLNNIDVVTDWTTLLNAREPQIHFSVDNSCMYIPLVADNKVTKKYLVYKFDGDKYVYTKSSN